MPAQEVDSARTVPLRRLAGFARGLSYSSSDYGSEGEGVPFINLKCVGKEGGFSGRGLKWFVGAVDPQSCVVPGDLLLANTDLTPGGQVVGRPLIVPDDMHGASISLDLTRLLIDRSVADRQYLFYALSGSHARTFMKGAARGTTVLHLELDRAKDCPVWLPSLTEQRAVADHLDAETARIDALIAKKQHLIHLLEERLDALVDDHFSPGPFDPTVRLARLARVQTGVTLNAGKVNTGETVRLPYLRVANVQPGRLDLSDVKEVDVDLAAAARSLLQPGDVLMTEGGDIDKLGRGTVWRGEVENCLHQNHVFAVRPQPGKLESEFLANVTRTSHARAYFESTGVQSTNLASTNSFKVADFRIPALDINAQRSRCASYEQSSRSLRLISEKLVQQITLLAEHRQALITAAVTGEFAVPGGT